jgi:integrating conjugative element protein (TIGR03757 family)
MNEHRRSITLAALAGAIPLLPSRTQGAPLDPFIGITTVEVFCNSAMLITLVQGASFQQAILRMDAFEQLSQTLSQRIPKGGEQVAYQWLMQNQAQIKRQLAPAAAAAANAINMANYYRINRLPAIVINRKSVIYGVTDVAEAITRYQAHRQRTP